MSSQPLRLLDREDMIQLTHLHCDVQCKFNFTYVLYPPDDCMLTVQQARHAWREVAARVAARWQHRQHKPDNRAVRNILEHSEITTPAYLACGQPRTQCKSRLKL